MNCEQVHALDLVDRYVTGQLPGVEMDEFETHYFSCEECLRLVQIAQAIQATAGVASNKVQVMTAAAGGGGTSSKDGSRLRLSYAAAAAVAVVMISVGGWRWMTAGGAKPGPAPMAHVPTDDRSAVAVAEAPASQEASKEQRAPAADLGVIHAPGYRESILRGVPDEARDRFRKAMEFYQRQDYQSATRALSQIPLSAPGGGAPEDHITDAGVAYFLGISQLMLGQNNAGVRSLEKAVAYGDTPYIEASRFYLAKGLIRQKNLVSASRQLRLAADLKGDWERPALQLLEQIGK